VTSYYISGTILAGGNHVAKDKESAELTERITTLVLPDELAAIIIISRKDDRKVSAYARRVLQADIERARKEKKFTEAEIKAEINSWPPSGKK
jgi:transcriptional regulator NrdR family protein